MRVFTLWSLRASWRVIYNEGVYLVVLEGLLEGDDVVVGSVRLVHVLCSVHVREVSVQVGSVRVGTTLQPVLVAGGSLKGEENCLIKILRLCHRPATQNLLLRIVMVSSHWRESTAVLCAGFDITAERGQGPEYHLVVAR